MLDSHLPLQSVQRALAGRYRLERRLGRGGMGIVLLAHELRLDRRVALKLLLPAKATDLLARERFLGEARTLGQRIRERGPLTPKEAARLLREVAWALAYAHERGVVHRDVKPDNILLDAATGRAVVSDFGIARVGVGSGTTGPREVVGTADFMSPEQASGRPVDARSDLYALGVVGYYALSGRLPFEAPDGYAMLARHIADPAPPLAAVAPDVPRRLAAVIDRCLMKDPSDRFVSGTELAEAAARAVAEPAVPPVAVRVFLVASRQLAGAALAYGALAGLAVPLLAGILLLPLAVMRWRVRRLLAAGFDRDDLTEALETELARRREERAFLYGHGPSRLERVLQGIAAAALASAAAVAGAHAIAPQLAPAAAWLTAFAASEGVALLAAVAARARTEHRTDPRWERRLRFWRSPLGGWLFRLAGLRLRRKDAPLQSAAPQPRGGAVGVVGDRFFEAREGRTVEDGRRR